MKLKTLLIATGLTLFGMNAAIANPNLAHAEPWTSTEWAQVKDSMPKGDVIRGENLANQGYCYSCHGVSGVNPTQSTPSLAGQNATYTFKMLKDYQSGRYHVDHKSEVMMNLVRVYNDQDLADLAVYYAAQPQNFRTYVEEDKTVDAGIVRLVEKGDHSRMITPCASCHGARGEGGMNETPALIGMSPRMFVRQMVNYRDGARHNDVNHGMAQFTKDLTDAEIESLATYYSQLKPRGVE